ncbi:TetR/AcrR family transcriptional regulator [Aureimonas sp. OT7]|uniref:TetR/AcrR family transcriptional regulator n=1 Tax=Aureimonas sp. OT7 TaxID=2816454 RepID=UPI001FED3FA8|nr:TetR/AcrR family transcriptional regulator [Aureimonas sp. OT7]
MATIVEATARILEDAGHHGFSTNAVARRAGVSIGSLYQYFPDKDALIGALVAREGDRLFEAAEAAASVPSGKDALERLIAAAVAHQFRRPGLARLLDFEEARLPFDASVRSLDDRFRRLLGELLAREDVRPQTDPQAAARDVLAIVKGMVNGAGAEGEQDTFGLTRRVRRAVFGYLETA